MLWNWLINYQLLSEVDTMQIEIKAALLGLIVHALQSSEGNLAKVSAELAETIGLQLLADLISQFEK